MTKDELRLKMMPTAWVPYNNTTRICALAFQYKEVAMSMFRKNGWAVLECSICEPPDVADLWLTWCDEVAGFGGAYFTKEDAKTDAFKLVEDARRAGLSNHWRVYPFRVVGAVVDGDAARAMAKRDGDSPW